MATITEYDEPNILFFKGVFPEKYDFDTMFTNKIMESVRMDDTTYDYEQDEQLPMFTPFDKMPTEFTTIADWPKTVNINCWWCNRKQKCSPKFIPKKIDVGTGNMTPHGSFDTFFCAAAYIDVYIDDRERQEKQRMLKILYKKMTGLHVIYIPRAPSPFDMIQYGYGVATPDSYGKKLSSLSQLMKTYTESPALHSIDSGTSPPTLEKYI